MTTTTTMMIALLFSRALLLLLPHRVTATATTAVEVLNGTTTTRIRDGYNNYNYKRCVDGTPIDLACKEQHRVCLLQKKEEEDDENDDDDWTEPFCGPCRVGYVELENKEKEEEEGENNNNNNSNSNEGEEGICVEIESTDFWEQFREAYDPVYSIYGDVAEEEKIVPPERRIEFLREAAVFITEHNNLLAANLNRSSNDADNNLTTTAPPAAGYSLGLTPWSADRTPEDYRSRSGYVYVNVTGTENELEPFNATGEYLRRFGRRRTRRRNLQFWWSSSDDNDDEAGGFGVGAASSSIPPRVDWVESGGVTHVKDQGRCGCCWAIGLTGAIEGGVFADPANGEYLQSLSFQQLISCSKVNGGCDGGNLALASLYAQLNLFKGVSTLNDYPYTDYFGKTSEECLAPASFVSSSSSSSSSTNTMPLAVTVNGAKRVAGYEARSNHAERLREFKAALALQPIAVAIKSSCKTLSNYRSGVLTDDGDCACGSVDCVDHAVLMVGYDDTAEIPHFKLKNSWGTKWGESGYFRIAQTPGAGQYGLFAMLAEGVVAAGRNSTAMVEDKIQTSPLHQWWVITLLVCGCVLAFLGFYYVFRKMCGGGSGSEDDPDK